MGFGIFSPSCDNQYKAVLAGAATSITGVDRLFVGFGAPPAVHWALAGTATDVYCRGWSGTDGKQVAMCALGGYVGGVVVSSLFR